MSFKNSYGKLSSYLHTTYKNMHTQGIRVGIRRRYCLQRYTQAIADTGTTKHPVSIRYADFFF